MKKSIALLALLMFIARGGHAISSDLRVGPGTGADGTVQQSRATRKLAQGVQDLGGRFEEAVSRGNVWTIQTKGTTVLATVNISPLPANGAPLVGLLNPAGNTKNFVILDAGCATISGTPGGPFYLDVVPSPSGVTLTTSAVIVNNLTYRNTGSSMIGFNNSGVNGLVAATSLRPLGGPAAIAAGAGNNDVEKELAGQIIIQPGQFVGISAHATGTTHIATCWITGEEVLP